MKLDWDVIREILLSIEALDQRQQQQLHYELNEDDEKGTAVHAIRLFKANFIEARDWSTSEGVHIVATDLTWTGHELLKTMQSNQVWAQIKALAKSGSSELTVELIKRLYPKALDFVFGT